MQRELLELGEGEAPVLVRVELCFDMDTSAAWVYVCTSANQILTLAKATSTSTLVSSLKGDTAASKCCGSVGVVAGPAATFRLPPTPSAPSCASMEGGVGLTSESAKVVSAQRAAMSFLVR